MESVIKHYRVVFFGTTVNRETFKLNMAKLGVSDATLARLIKKTPIVVKRDLSLADARRYADALMSAGGIVSIQQTDEFPVAAHTDAKTNMASSQNFVLCPNCGFKQERKGLCARCDFDLASFPVK